ncbi:LAG1 longevity assurance-like protein [Actinidia rufa]|uniref:LAG1 longevity assurance-like protein n=1 Tax=Actinidia rufa TaxID=165716 RepID=A0A7J0GA85_9ERIC|nr:LAG1 longevity assurance-like protein [Actinidia rufa]
MGFDWESESDPMYKDFVVLPFFIIFFPAFRFLLDRYIFEKLARRLPLGKAYAKTDFETRFTRKKLIKFKEAAWKFVHFLSAELLALSVTYGEPWFTDTRYFWVGPGDQVWPDQKINYEATVLLDKDKHMFDGTLYKYLLFNALLFCLLGCHIYWWRLMFRMLINQVQARGQISDDPRSGKWHKLHVKH